MITFCTSLRLVCCAAHLVEELNYRTLKVKTNLSSGLQTAGKLELVHAVVHGLAIGGTLRDGAFTASSAHTDSVDYVACSKQNKTSRKTHGYN